MSDICSCIPTSNVVCQQQSDLVLSMPSCQVINGQGVKGNPYYDEEVQRSYWTYKIMTLCNLFPNQVEDIYIPIYENIEMNMLTVYEIIPACNGRSELAYDFTNPIGIMPPVGFKYVHIETEQGYRTGACILYQLAIIGENIPSSQSLYVNTDNGLFSFDAGFPVPGQLAAPMLSLAKEAVLTIEGSSGFIDYTVTVTNTGNQAFNQVLLQDNIDYPGNMVMIGPITAQPSSIQVDTSVNGMMRLSGNLGVINMGQTVLVTYRVPLNGFSGPGTYNFNSRTMVMNEEIQAGTETVMQVPVVELINTMNSAVTGVNTINMILDISNVGNSPQTSIIATAVLVIPSTLTMRLMNLSGCQATIGETTEPALANTDYSGINIRFICPMTVPLNGMAEINIPVQIQSVRQGEEAFSTLLLRLDDVVLEEAGSQVFLGATPIPLETSIRIGFGQSGS